MSSSDSEAHASMSKAERKRAKEEKRQRKEERRAKKADKEAKKQAKEAKRTSSSIDDEERSRKDRKDAKKAAKEAKKSADARVPANPSAPPPPTLRATSPVTSPKQPQGVQLPPATNLPYAYANEFASSSSAQAASNPFAPTATRASSRRAPSPFYPQRPPAPSPFFPRRLPTPGTGQTTSSTPALNPRDFPPGLDLSSIKTDPNEDEGQTGPSTRTTRSSTPRRITTAALDAAISSAGNGASRGSRVPRARTGVHNAAVHTASTGESLQKSKSATLDDARGLTEAQILSEKLYQPHQFKWLEEAGMLTTLKKGIFTTAEREAMRTAFEAFWTRNGMTFEQGQETLTSRSGRGEADLYAQMTSNVTAAVPGRSQRAVRRYLREWFHPDARKGSWTDLDVWKLVKAHDEVGSNWTVVSQRVGRIPRDCRTRVRDHWDDDVKRVKEMQARGGPAAQDNGEGSSSAASPSASPPANVSAKKRAGPEKPSSWTSKEIRELLKAVPEVCAQLNIDLQAGGTPSWKVISTRIKTKAASSCQRKWDEIRIARMKGKTDEEIIANKRTGRSSSYLSARDNRALVRRLETQAGVHGWDDEKSVDWGKVRDDEDDADGAREEGSLLFGKNELSKAWKRLKDRSLPGAAAEQGKSAGATKKMSFQEQLEILRPIVEKEHEIWRATQQMEGETPRKKKRGVDDARSPSGSPSKRPKRAIGTGAVDLGDEIGSDEDM